MKNIINRSVDLRLELYYSPWEHIDTVQERTEDCSCSPWSDFDQRGSWQENPGLPEGEDRRERGVSLQNQKVPTHKPNSLPLTG